jgi:hypothetical protein
MRVKVKMHKNVLRNLEHAQIIALEQTAEAVKTDVIMKNVMPFDDGALQNESTMIDTSKSKSGIVAISSDLPYARKVYFHPEYNFKTDKNPNAQGRWYDSWIDGKHKAFAINAYKKLYKRLTGV